MRVNALCHRLRLAKKGPPPAVEVWPLDETLSAESATASVEVRLREKGPSASAPPPARIDTESRVAYIGATLEQARSVIEDIEDPWKHPWKRFCAWWTGSTITLAWESVHEAEAELVHIESDAEVRESLPPLLAWIQQVVESGEQRERHESRLTDFIEETRPLARTAVRQAYRDVIRANRKRQNNTRLFRNGLLLTTVVIAVVLLTLAVWHAINPNFISLCGAEDRCLMGTDPRPSDVAMVVLVGTLGGLLGIAFGFGKLETPPSRYDPRNFQVGLKPVAGAATALIGVLLVQGDILIAPVGETSESLLLAYAAIFGFSQQGITRFVDKHADKVLGEKDEKASTE